MRIGNEFCDSDQMGIVVLVQSDSTKSVLQSVQEFFGPHWFIRVDNNRDEIINIGDMVYSVSYLYKSGPAPIPREPETPIAMRSSMSGTWSTQ